MDALFGDATTAMPTPAQHAEVDSLMSGINSPVPSLDIRRPGNFTADNAIPGLDINPPMEEEGDGNAKKETGKKEGGGEGLGGWISSMVARTRGEGKDRGGGGGGGSYGRLESQEED